MKPLDDIIFSINNYTYIMGDNMYNIKPFINGRDKREYRDILEYIEFDFI